MSDSPNIPIIQDLYPDLSPEEQADAEHTLHQFIKLVHRIFVRLKNEGKLDEVLAKFRKEQKNSGDREKS